MPGSSPHSVDQRDLLRAICAGDQASLATWFRRHQDALYSFVYYRVGSDPDLAADATQATFAAALERLSEYDSQRGEMITWLCFLSRNIIRQMLAQLRKNVQWQAVWDRIDDSLRQALEQIDRESLPDAVLENKETRKLVSMALANLPVRYRQALEDRYMLDQPVEAMARVRETSIDSVKSMLRRARAAFRECFLTMARVEVSDVRTS